MDMRHMDDGTLHTWLDGQVSEPADAAWIEEHLRGCETCRARLTEERTTRDRADALLAAAAPAGGQPPFQELVARAASASARRVDDLSAEPQPLSRGARRAWLVPASWAASLVLAVALGWTARDAAPTSSGTRTLAERISVADTHAPSPAGAPATPGTTSSRSATIESPEDTSSSRAAAARPSAAESRPASAASDPSADAAPVAAPAPVAPLRADSTPRGEAPGAPFQPPVVVVPSQPPVVDVQSTRRSSVPPDDTQRDARTAERLLAEVATVPVPMPAPAPVPPVWQTLPRTEAAARTGMALYGIDGLDPTLTAVSTGGGAVRTVYTTESGETVELVQHRVATPAPSVTRVLTSPQVSSFAAGGLAAGGGPEWSTVRGDVRVTIRSASAATDLSALGAKIRVD